MSGVPYRVDKPWGYEVIWARTDRYVGKILHVNAGHALSCQYHRRKDETLYVLRGELIVRTTGAEGAEGAAAAPAMEQRVMRAGESLHIPPGTVHELEAVVDTDLLEASTPDLDDLVRLRDRYGRV